MKAALRALFFLPDRSLSGRSVLSASASVAAIVFGLLVFLLSGPAFDLFQSVGQPGRWRFHWSVLTWPLSFVACLVWWSWLLERSSLQVVGSDHGVIEMQTQEERRAYKPALAASAALLTGLLMLVLSDWIELGAQYWLNIQFDTRPWALAWLFLALCIFTWRSLKTSGVWLATRSLTLVAALLPLAMLSLAAYRYAPGPYLSKVVPSDPNAQSMASDAVWASQQNLFPKRLAALQAQRKGLVDAYFVSYAPDAEDQVFRRETDVIAQLMDSRFDTAGRSMRLINHANTYQKHPAAVVDHLQKTLKRIGELIDPNEDLVLIYLSSHGSADHRLLSRADRMSLRHLTPVMLERMLQDAGIRYAVVAVSACFSGGWLPGFSKPNYLVMTASAANKTSFGCGNDSDFTYWGKAVFDEGLRASFDFEQAFNEALPRIRQRELAMRQTPSDPQIFVGEDVRVRLKAWQAQLESKSIDALKANGAVSVTVTEVRKP